MERLMCSRCGETLHYEGGLLKCSYCGASYDKESQEDTLIKLEEALGQAKMELIANRKRHLWDITHEKYPSKEKVVEAANAVISISAEDFLARIYLHSHDRNPLKLNAILASSKVDSSQAAEAFRWLLPSLSSKTVGSLHDFVDRHFSGKDRFDRITQIEEEASKVSQGIYEPGLPRDVFLCYSSYDMPRVIGLLDLLERNGFVCFAAFRNLRHGKGAQEDYLSAIKTAMRACEVLVFVSSESSRSMDCDALKVELPYLIQELPDKPRVEYVIEDYEDTPFLVKRTLKKAFPSQEYCQDEEDLMIRIEGALDALSPEKRINKEQKEAGRVSEYSFRSQPIDEDELRRQAEEKVKQELLSEKFENEAREKILAEEQRKKAIEAKAKEKFLRDEGDYVYYGRYPQTKVTDYSTTIALRKLKPGNHGYISYNDEEYVEFKSDYYLVQPIKWRVLQRKDNELFVVSDLILDALRYNENYRNLKNGHFANNYRESEIRGWLNGEFLASAFALGKEHILAALVDNSPATTNASDKLFGNSVNTFACEDTKDMVFLPSCLDYRNPSFGFNNKVSRRCSPSDYAFARGVSLGCYWTRSPSSSKSHGAWGIDHDGSFYCYENVNNDFVGVRPALMLNTSVNPSDNDETQSPKSAASQEIMQDSDTIQPEEAYISYGKYPQAKVSDESIVSILKSLKPDRNGYLSYNGEEYAEAKGEYFLVQPIRWRILDRKDNEALIVSDLVLDAQRFNEKYDSQINRHYANNYEFSEIRAWLNNEFLPRAFPLQGQKLLLKKVDNSIATTDVRAGIFDDENRYACASTNDKVFLLSYKDYQSAGYAFFDSDSRKCKPTDYAIAKGAYTRVGNGVSWYWSRSPHSGCSTHAWTVGSDGNIYDSDVDRSQYGVRPAVWISIDE